MTVTGPTLSYDPVSHGASDKFFLMTGRKSPGSKEPLLVIDASNAAADGIMLTPLLCFEHVHFFGDVLSFLLSSDSKSPPFTGALSSPEQLVKLHQVSHKTLMQPFST
ncbi:hypothetical protein T4D_15529 [Trichinella pseudospiralis]|uniref:Uncharacterized protein n=1 Tax=Trichinella pseudospiralis TaxID=6337 RepID=A0A0V1G5M1_TRIPS|nr:hypothetical protein T4D_15529 [Trichinella pseudospiralis]